MPYRMNNNLFLLCLLCLVLPLVGGCGNKTESVPQLTDEEQKKADYYTQNYTGGRYDSEGKDVLLYYLILMDRKTPEKTVFKLARYFVSLGADVNAKQISDGSGHQRTPLHLAAGFNPDYSAGKNSINVDLVKYLVSKGADVNAKDGDGETPLHEAVKFSNVGAAKFLISKKADVNARDNEGNSPLHWAAMRNGKTDIAKALIAKGADVGAEERWGKTPRDLAEEVGNEVLAKYLATQKPKKSGSSSQPPTVAEKEIRDCFTRYKAAILNGQGEEAAACIDEKTISYYFWADIRIMRSDRNDIEKKPLLERIFLLSARHQIPYLKLDELSHHENRGRAYFVYAVENGLIGKESVEKIELAKVFVDSIDGSKAKTTISSDGKIAPFGFDFVLEDGKWKMDLTSMFPIAEEALKIVIQQSGMSESQFILALLEQIGRAHV